MFEKDEEVLESLAKSGYLSPEQAAQCRKDLGSSASIKNFTTAELVEELKTRGGVGFDVLEPLDSYELTTRINMFGKLEEFVEKDSGPCTIFIVVD